ncbi:MAG: non-heme iron oxygenase ferredoxin subunit [Pirellulaceae bacterium]
MSDFIKAAGVAEVPDPGKITVEVDDRMVVLVHVGGRFYCIDDVCTHDGGPLGNGRLCGLELACPRHGARFDVQSGKALTMPATEDTVAHEVQLRGDEVWVRLRD